MVNLKEHIIESTNNEKAFIKNYELFHKFVAKSDREFIQKILKATKEVILDKSISEKNKYYCLQLVHLLLQINNKYLFEAFKNILAFFLVNLAINISNNEGKDFEKDGLIFKSINSKHDPEYYDKFSELLIEAIEFWSANFGSSEPIFEEMMQELKKVKVRMIDPKYAFDYFDLFDKIKTKNEKETLSKKETNKISKFKDNSQEQFNLNRRKSEKSVNFASELIDRTKIESIFIKISAQNEHISQFMNARSESEDNMTEIFKLLNDLMNQILPFLNNITDTQQKILSEGKRLLECYQKAETFSQLKAYVLKKENNDKKTSKISNKEQNLENPGRIKTVSNKLNYGNDVILNKTNQKINGTHNPRSEIIKKESLSEIKDTTENKEQIMEYIETERKQLIEKIEMLTLENRRLEFECKRKQKTIVDIEEKSRIDQSHLKKIEIDLEKSQNLVEKFVKKLNNSLGPSIYKKDDFGDYKDRSNYFNEVNSQKMKESNQIGIPVDRINLEESGHPSLSNYKLNSNSEYRQSNYLMPVETTLTSSLPRNNEYFGSPLYGGNAYADSFVMNEKKGFPQGSIGINDFEMFKRKMESNNDFVKNFNNDISISLNSNSRGIESSMSRKSEPITFYNNQRINKQSDLHLPLSSFGPEGNTSSFGQEGPPIFGPERTPNFRPEENQNYGPEGFFSFKGIKREDSRSVGTTLKRNYEIGTLENLSSMPRFLNALNGGNVVNRQIQDHYFSNPSEQIIKGIMRFKRN